MTKTSRALMPDYLRLFALFGIVVVNVQYMGYSAFSGFPQAVGATLIDKVTIWLVYGLALLKSYGLFSFMFGVGLGFLMSSAERRGHNIGPLYRNRMIGLLLLGLLHGCLFFPGDILVIYAVTGSIVYFFRFWSIRRLVIVGSILVTLQVLVNTPLLLIPDDGLEDLIALEALTFTSGTFWEVAAFRSIGFAVVLGTGLVFQGISALGWFCLGLAAVKAGLIDQSNHRFWKKARQICLIPGLALSLLGAGLIQWTIAPSLGIVLTLASAPIATIGYLGLIAKLARSPGKLMSKLLAAGGSSLSIYLGQSLTLSTLFTGYGLGLWGALDRSLAVALAILVTLVLIIALSAWRSYFKLGPFEWVLRSITYAGLKPDSAK